MTILAAREICRSAECVLSAMLQLAYRRITYAFCATLGTFCSTSIFCSAGTINCIEYHDIADVSRCIYIAIIPSQTNQYSVLL